MLPGNTRLLPMPVVAMVLGLVMMSGTGAHSPPHYPHPPHPPHTLHPPHPPHPPRGSSPSPPSPPSPPTVSISPWALKNSSLSARLSNNLCRVCTNTVFKCTHNVTVRCPDNVESNSTVTWPNKNATGKADFPDFYDDEWNKNSDTDDTKLSGSNLEDQGLKPLIRKKGQRPGRGRGFWRRRWNDHANNWGVTTTPKPLRNSTEEPVIIRPFRRCVYSLVRNCIARSCQLQCCDGSTMDPITNSCQPPTDKLSCKNGGSPSGNEKHCICPDGYTGDECQQRKCSVTCQNGGVCRTNTSRTGKLEDTTYNDDHCVCPADSTGKFCEKKQCTQECQNNGTCTEHSLYPSCMCAEGFYGTYCEKKKKAGDCPVSTNAEGCAYPYPHYLMMREHCSEDHDCPGDKKCCRSACRGPGCTDPYHATSSCAYNNETYSLGTVFMPDSCRVCTCNSSHVGHLQGVVECTRLVCPEVPKYCTNVTTPQGACCPVCNDDPDVAMCAGNYTYPYFLNCPEEMVVIDVTENSDEAHVNFDLQAKDCKGDKLDVYLADEYLYAGVGEENFQLSSATTARDGKGNFAECVFHVRVRDIYPPVFLTCPTDFTEPAPGPVTWEIPVARDNVGLAILPTSRRHPGDKMAAGEYMIEYWAEDYQGNIARCSFVVTVADYHKDITPSHHIGGHVAGGDGAYHPSHAHLQPLPHSHASISIGIGISTTLLVIVLIALALLFYRRQRNQRNASASGASVTRETGMGWNNGGRSHCPPQYSLPPDDIMSPPMYSRSDEMMGTASGGMQEAGELPSKSPFS